MGMYIVSCVRWGILVMENHEGVDFDVDRKNQEMVERNRKPQMCRKSGKNGKR